MAYITLTNITVLDNPTAFTNPFQFEVTFECAQQLEAGTSIYIFPKITTMSELMLESHCAVVRS